MRTASQSSWSGSLQGLVRVYTNNIAPIFKGFEWLKASGEIASVLAG